MFPPREIVLNTAMRFPHVQRYARSRHDTGLMTDADKGQGILERFVGELGGSLDGRAVLEIGPGQGMGLMRAAHGNCARYAAFDVVDYLGSAPFDELGVDYRTDVSGLLPWSDAEFDVVWSYSVLEHVSDPKRLLVEAARVLKSEGMFIASIDLESHSGGRNEPQRMFEFLRFSDSVWNAMTSRRSTFVNRLRVSHWRALLAEVGLEIENEQLVRASCELAALRAVPYLSNLSDEDISTRQVLFAARRS